MMLALPLAAEAEAVFVAELKSQLVLQAVEGLQQLLLWAVAFAEAMNLLKVSC